MHQVSVIKPMSNDELPNDFYRHCNSGNVEHVHDAIMNNVNIYQTFSDMKLTPLLFALHTKKEHLVNMLLDVYERDLEVLKDTNFNRAFMAYESDLSDEFYACCVERFSSEADIEPVLVKVNNQELPKCFYFRKQLQNKDDSCLRVLRDLEQKNGLCDLNWRFIWPFHPDDYKHGESYLQLAAYFGMINVSKRLLTNKTVDKHMKRLNLLPLHYAINSKRIEVVKAFIEYYNNEFVDDKSFLWHAVTSRNSEIYEFIVGEMLKIGNYSLKEIYAINFDVPIVSSNVFHLIALNKNYKYFLNHKLPINEVDVITQTGKGNTILHILAYKNEFIFYKDHFIKIAEKFPKLLTIQNERKHYPIHILAMNSFEDVKLVEDVYELTMKATGNRNFMFQDVEHFVELLTSLIGRTNKKVLKFFIDNSCQLNIIEDYGNRLLHYAIRCCQSNFECFKFLLECEPKIDPNVFYDGSNAFMCCLAVPNFNFQVSCEMSMFDALTKHCAINDVNVVDTGGISLIMYVASFCEDLNLIKKLIDMGADSSFCEDLNLIKKLIDMGADCKKVSNDGRTIFHFATSNQKNEEIFPFLLEQGIDPKIVDIKGDKAITLATRNRNNIAFQFLLQFETDDELSEKFGREKQTLLHITSQGYDGLNLELLLDRNLCFDAIDNNGNHFIHQMLQRRPHFAMSTLQKMKARKILIRLNMKNNDGDSLFSLAAREGLDEVLKFFLENYYDEIDFRIVNKRKQNLTHQMCYSRNVVRFHELLLEYPILQEVMNEQMGQRDDNGSTPLDFMIPSPLLIVESCVADFLIQFVSMQNLQKFSYMFVKDLKVIERILENLPSFFEDFEEQERFLEALIASPDDEITFNFVVHRISMEKVLSNWKGGKNILHLLAEKNNKELIDSLLKRLNSDQLNALATQIDGHGKTPKDLLNDDNKMMFEKCF
ncbi:CLUMA_CG016964, isoform A [Clunio marinus]|uniref:CLUMA_CG016964, isoform A n=1 Tax=Clunio marinus TaxID=568069 RepID=A0A1J1IU07_9DIPT|nr:CLUMA_CG016964, isoform A [Clunio marinus]